MITAVLGVAVVLAEAAALTLALYRPQRQDDGPVFKATEYDPAAEARTVILPAVDLDDVDRVRPYIRNAPPWVEPSNDLDPRVRRDLISGYTVARMLVANRQLVFGGGVG